MEKSENTWIKTTTTYSRCPNCKNGVLDTRVARSFVVKYILKSNVKRYKCDSCGKKTYVKND